MSGPAKVTIREFAPPFQGDQRLFPVHQPQQEVLLDMKSERGKEILWRLVDQSDVLVENFRPGAMERLGFGYEAVRARRPAMVYCSIPDLAIPGRRKIDPATT